MITLCFCAFLLVALLDARLPEAETGLLNTRTMLSTCKTLSKVLREWSY